MKKLIPFFLSFFILIPQLRAQQQIIKSPDHKICLSVNLGSELSYELTFHGINLIQPSPISVTLENGRILGKKPELIDVKTSTKSTVIANSLYRKSNIVNNYNELTLKFKGNYSAIFRLFNDGFAYRFVTDILGTIKIKDELTSYRFLDADSNNIWFIPRDSVVNSGEGSYTIGKINDLAKSKLALTPMLINSYKINALIFEADVFDYPKMFLQTETGVPNSIKGKFSKEVATEVHNGWVWNPTSYHNFIAESIAHGDGFVVKIEKNN